MQKLKSILLSVVSLFKNRSFEEQHKEILSLFEVQKDRLERLNEKIDRDCYKQTQELEKLRAKIQKKQSETDLKLKTNLVVMARNKNSIDRLKQLL